jgi:acid phosphatase type 7
MRREDDLRFKPVFKNAINDIEKFQPLPEPTGIYPFRLGIEEVLNTVSDQKMIFHVSGDTGNVKYPNFQGKIVHEMSLQFQEGKSREDNPLFFYHLGDVVYNHGEEEHYFKQFFEPYKNYPAPVFAIPGNHDGDVRSDVVSPPKSLAAFKKVFCDTQPQVLSIAGNTQRTTNIQPNVYWTLKTPLANFIGVYSNVPKFGVITEEQKKWFMEELVACRNEAGKALIVCLHHSPYSADINHGSSLPMQIFLNEAFEKTSITPDIVFSGHVHNYQRFSKYFPGGKIVPFIVAGAGGYADLHTLADLDDPEFSRDSPLLNDVYLEKYCDQCHGFLKIAIERTDEGLTILGEYYSIPEPEKNSQASLFDRFEVRI